MNNQSVEIRVSKISEKKLSPPKYNRRFKELIALCLLIWFASGSSCIFPVDEIQQAINQIDKGIDTIHGESDKWNSTIKEIAENLPKQAKEIVRNELTQLVERATISAGVEFRCNTDFLANRAIQGLLRLKAMLKKEAPPPILPSFCQISPGFLDLNEPAESRSKIIIGGYDMDKKDKKGNEIKYFLFSDITKQKIEIDNSRIGRTTHYVNILNTSGDDWENLLKTNKITKIQMFWEDAKVDSAEVLVISKKPQKKEVKADLGIMSLTPSHIRGDRDFDTDDDEPMSFYVIGEANLQENKIMTRIYMNAREERDDWTQVESWSAWNIAYTPPQGWKIVSFSPNTRAERRGLINQHGPRTESLSAGELVTRFDINGDKDGDEAGSWTSVTAKFNTQVKIQLVEDFVPYTEFNIAPNKNLIIPLPKIMLPGSN